LPRVNINNMASVCHLIIGRLESRPRSWPARSRDDALEKLEPAHLSHGVRASEDEKLLRKFAAAGTSFHAYPTSNVLLGAARDYANHPHQAIAGRGLQRDIPTPRRKH
jgi:hypothetical protein